MLLSVDPRNQEPEIKKLNFFTDALPSKMFHPLLGGKVLNEKQKVKEVKV